jgi:copper chaperone CopZ
LLPVSEWHIKFTFAEKVALTKATGTTSMEENIQEIIFEVEGIICTGCAMDMENVMLNTDGIEEASVNYAEGTFTISYDADEIDAQNVFERVKKLGFKTNVLPGPS